MQFNSYIFILLFLPITLLLYFLGNKINTLFGKIILILSGVVFYAYGGLNLAVILLVSIIINLLLAYAVKRFPARSKLFIGITVVVNVGLLFHFKYLGFVLQNINAIFTTDFSVKNILLPLGISFFTFQQIMYVVSVYRGDIGRIDIVDYLVYILYFPKLIMGPLCEPEDIIGQLNDATKKTFNIDNFACGIRLFSYGIFKKLILADTFHRAVSWGFTNKDILSAFDIIVLMLSYTFEIYFDFGGYSDMAVGISKMLNIDLPINFDSPYKALSIRDFWKRWHISLTGFLTKYIYIPLGGSKKGKGRTYLNTMVVFLISGIWHGANWTFILWGVFHGLLSVLERIINIPKKKGTIIIKWLLTFVIINILWLLFRADSVAEWWELLSRVILINGAGISDGMINAFVLPEIQAVISSDTLRRFSIMTFVSVSALICLVPENNYKTMNKKTAINMFLAAAAFVWSFLCLSSESVFVYFNF